MFDEIKRIKDRIDYRLDAHLCEMKEGYDDSICGFNEAWDLVRTVFSEALSSPPQDGEREKALEAALKAAENITKYERDASYYGEPGRAILPTAMYRDALSVARALIAIRALSASGQGGKTTEEWVQRPSPWQTNVEG